MYYGHFKCNLRRILDYPNLQGYLMDLYQQPGIAETVNFDHIKRHYYITHDDINPDAHRADRSRRSTWTVRTAGRNCVKISEDPGTRSSISTLR